MKRVLLHCCCAPCTCYVLECLIPDYRVSLLFYNPNIEPHAEYEKRKNELLKFLAKASLITKIKLLECNYNHAAFVEAVLSLRGEPEGGARCRVCYKLRLKETAAWAKAGGYDVFATTLSVSPHKNAELLNQLGSELADEYDVEYLPSDFKKNDGYKRSIELAKKYGLYRQNYCGCRDN
ncbi:MAG: epoxyqueuosine reductase QueH [Oscillospiraceae bacterium]|jgi:predicted adenine nucleotide alpha hydrolase (AANH) superfamily ATPase|nr:epoxyqueuosine reductase QueH [Oscillospiraceae bacterium]